MFSPFFSDSLFKSFLSGFVISYLFINYYQQFVWSYFHHLLDNYLSPLTYDGIGFRYDYSSRKYLSPNNLKLSRENQFNINIAVTENPAKTSNISYLGMDYSWGLHYHFRPAKNVQLLAGGLWDIEFGLKANSRNQNNPMNIDLATNLNFSGMAIYDTRILKYPFRFNLLSLLLFRSYVYPRTRRILL